MPYEIFGILKRVQKSFRGKHHAKDSIPSLAHAPVRTVLALAAAATAGTGWAATQTWGAPGGYTWVPAGVTQIDLELSGGGGGGGAVANGGVRAGGAGGPGGRVQTTAVAVTPGATLYILVGGGGGSGGGFPARAAAGRGIVGVFAGA